MLEPRCARDARASERYLAPVSVAVEPPLPARCGLSVVTTDPLPLPALRLLLHSQRLCVFETYDKEMH
jgi:hypothetical protein